MFAKSEDYILLISVPVVLPKALVALARLLSPWRAGQGRGGATSSSRSSVLSNRHRESTCSVPLLSESLCLIRAVPT